MGAALFSSVWTATHRQDSYNYDGTADIQRFERSQETMTSDGELPVVYGRRQISGNQTYHKTNSDSTTLWKHVVLCEGGIEGIESVTANDLLIPTGSQTSNTVFTIQNVKYADARVKRKGIRLPCMLMEIPSRFTCAPRMICRMQMQAFGNIRCPWAHSFPTLTAWTKAGKRSRYRVPINILVSCGMHMGSRMVSMDMRGCFG